MQADLSLCWAHISEGMFSDVVAHTVLYWFLFLKIQSLFVCFD